jgi:hypothetical protein
MSDFNAYVGLDVHKDSILVAIAEAGRDGEVRQWGMVRNTPEAVAKLARRLVERHQTASSLTRMRGWHTDLWAPGSGPEWRGIRSCGAGVR